MARPIPHVSPPLVRAFWGNLEEHRPARGLILFCALLLVPALGVGQPGPALAQTTYYVRQIAETRQGRSLPAGSDHHTCEQAQSPQTARASVNMGIACMAGGDELRIGAGAYDELIFGQYTNSLQCAEGDSLSQKCHVVPNGLDPDRPTRLIGTGSAILSPQRTPSGGGSIFTAYDATRHVHLEGLRFLWNTASGSAAGVHFGNAQSMTLTRSEVEGGTVKSGDTSRYHTITHNHLHHSRGKDCQPDQKPSPQTCSHATYTCGTDHVLTDNRIEYSGYYGVHASCEQGGIARITIARNTIAYGASFGIRCAGDDCLVGSNLLVGNGGGISLTGSGTVAHNTIDGVVQTSWNPDPMGIAVTWGDGSGFQIADNILTGMKNSSLAIWNIENAPWNTSRVQANLCETSGNSGCLLVGQPSSLYTNQPQGDYSLKRTKDNPALGAGVPVAQVPTDLRGRPYSTTHPSVGAYALEGPTPPTPQPPGALVFACEGALQDAGRIALTCRPQEEARR